MGWSFNLNPSQTKAHFVDELNNNFAAGYTLLQHRVVGNHLWQLVQNKEGRKFICLCLMERARGEGWGYKGMDETAGPTATDCPLSLLDAADPPPADWGYAAEWRARVRAHHAAKKEHKSALGPDKVVEYGGNKYRLVRPAGPRKGWVVVGVHDGFEYRMRAHQLAHSQVVA